MMACWIFNKLLYHRFLNTH